MKTHSNWYEHFFHGLAVDLWMAAVPDRQTRQQARYLRDALRLAPGHRALDVPCGAGRLAIELASEGIAMTGLDLSEEFLSHARRIAADRGVEIDWVAGDMRDLPWTATFDAAFCAGNSFGYLDHGGNAKFLASVASALKPGGRFLLETGIALESLLPAHRDSFQIDVGGIRMSIRNAYDPRSSRLETEYVFERAGREQQGVGVQHAYACRELIAMVEAAGFGDVRTLTWDGEREQDSVASGAGLRTRRFMLGDRMLIIEAVRAG